jgi:hypothetical protein
VIICKNAVTPSSDRLSDSQFAAASEADQIDKGAVH